MMQIDVPSDLQTLIERRLSSGEYSSPEQVLRHALEALEIDETWTIQERSALDEKISRSLQQFADGKFYGPAEAMNRLALLREKHLSKR